MRTFFTIWCGQLVSHLGSQLTGFALGVWVYDQSHSVTMLALAQVAMMAPYVLLSPLAGVFADRWNRRTAMIVSDSAADLQGRGFAFRRTIAMSASLVAPLLAAPLTDYIFKPAMAPGGALVRVLGPIFGVGASRGVASCSAWWGCSSWSR